NPRARQTTKTRRSYTMVATLKFAAPRATEQPVEWARFTKGLWQKEINVRDFIQHNYTPYEGDESFLAGVTERTKKVWRRLTDLFVLERERGVLDVSQIPSSITAHA